MFDLFFYLLSQSRVNIRDPDETEPIITAPERDRQKEFLSELLLEQMETT